MVELCFLCLFLYFTDELHEFHDLLPEHLRLPNEPQSGTTLYPCPGRTSHLPRAKPALTSAENHHCAGKAATEVQHRYLDIVHHLHGYLLYYRIDDSLINLSYFTFPDIDYPAKKKEDIMPVVIVEMWEGRTVEQKKQLAEGITSSFVKIGVPPEVVHIIMKDNPKHN